MHTMRWMIIGMLLCGLATLTGAAKPREMSVQVRNGQVRATPSFLGQIVGTLDYGDRVQIVETQGAWQRIESGKASGWMHESALTKQKIVLAAGDTDVGGAATTEEIAMAGKGFSAEVEAEYRKQNTDIDFAWIDRMETMEVSLKKITDFLREGGVAPVGGAR